MAGDGSTQNLMVGAAGAGLLVGVPLVALLVYQSYRRRISAESAGLQGQKEKFLHQHIEQLQRKEKFLYQRWAADNQHMEWLKKELEDCQRARRLGR